MGEANKMRQLRKAVSFAGIHACISGDEGRRYVTNVCQVKLKPVKNI